MSLKIYFFIRDHFLFNYVGEKVFEWNRKKNGYTLVLYVDKKCPSKSVYIDASTHGNISRFVNHSCDPNCITEVVCV